MGDQRPGMDQLAFLARRDLPLFLVQSAVAAGLGVTAILGVLLMKWRHPPAEVAPSLIEPAACLSAFSTISSMSPLRPSTRGPKAMLS